MDVYITGQKIQDSPIFFKGRRQFCTNSELFCKICKNFTDGQEIGKRPGEVGEISQIIFLNVGISGATILQFMCMAVHVIIPFLALSPFFSYFIYFVLSCNLLEYRY